MPSIRSLVKWPLKKVYYWLARPLRARFREELEAALDRFRQEHPEWQGEVGKLRQDGERLREEVRVLRQAAPRLDEVDRLRHDGERLAEEINLLCQDREGRQAEQDRLRQECDQRVRGELAQAVEQLAKARDEIAEMKRMQEEVWAELTQMNQNYLEFHTGLTRQVADEVTRLNRKLETVPTGDGVARRAA